MDARVVPNLPVVIQQCAHRDGTAPAHQLRRHSPQPRPRPRNGPFEWPVPGCQAGDADQTVGSEDPSQVGKHVPCIVRVEQVEYGLPVIEGTLLPAAAVVPIDESLPLDLAALLGCGVTTARTSRTSTTA
ncbi:hypothetical protein [Mycobacterium servetii]|uniref:Uncharacterized protein n=1 Tax=Mycobacterium servetii TaxID=3237418 RepID=A0ABV4C4S9_9MYCO